jgi:hypothetical protein
MVRPIQKNPYLRSRQVRNFSSAGIRPKSMYRFGITGCKLTAVELTPQRQSVKILLDLNLGLERNVVLALANRNSSQF